MNLGQHFLIDEKVLKLISSYVNEDDTILEIGAGYGNLTKYLLKAKKVYAIEIDRNLFYKLKRIKSRKLIPILGDILNFEIPRDVNKIVGNIPYKISSKITEKVLRFLKKDQIAVLMYQKEFAERLVANPCERNYSRITILAKYLSKPKIIAYVPKRLFNPIPKVDSVLVKFVSNGKKYDENFFKFVKQLFSHKRKKLKNAIYDSLKLKIDIGKIEDKRVYCLSLKDLELIFKKYRELI